MNNDVGNNHIGVLVTLAVVFPIVVIFISRAFGVMVDLFDIEYYFINTQSLMQQGAVPYFIQSLDYSPLALVPMILAYIPAILANNKVFFLFSFMALMLLCNIGIVVCVYCISFVIYSDAETAYRSGILSVCGLSGAYLVMTKFDAFPIFIMLFAIAYILYEDNPIKGYITLVAGVFTKFFVVVVAPFLVLYNNRNRGRFVYSEIKHGWVVCTLILFVCSILFFVRNSIYNYITEILIRHDAVNVNTPAYLVYTFVSWITPLVPFDVISVIAYCLMGVCLVVLLFFSAINKNQTPRNLITYIACALIVITYCASYRSPQASLWFVPLIAILVADSVVGSILLIAYQTYMFIEFPITFGLLWRNAEYVNVSLAMIMFAFEFVMIIIMMYIILKNNEVKQHV